MNTVTSLYWYLGDVYSGKVIQGIRNKFPVQYNFISVRVIESIGGTNVT